MAHFAELDENGVVLRVIVVANAALGNLPYPESEAAGVEFLRQHYGYTRWRQTSYSKSFRKNYAGIGDKFDRALDGFIGKKPYASWVLDDATCQWVAPVKMPTDGKPYAWDEKTLAWKPIRKRA